MGRLLRPHQPRPAKNNRTGRKETRERNREILLAWVADAVAVYQPWRAVTGSIAARRVRGGLVAELWEALKSKGIGG